MCNVSMCVVSTACIRAYDFLRVSMCACDVRLCEYIHVCM